MPAPRVIANVCGRVVRRSLPALVATCVLGVVGTGAWLGYRFVTSSPRFAIEAIDVHGTKRLSADEVRAALAVQVGDNVFTANLGTLGEDLRKHPWIATAEAHRILPHTLVVEIREYEAAAIVSLGELYLVDATGHPFKRVELDAGDGEGLPIVTGIERTAYQRDPVGTARTIVEALGVLAIWRTGDRPAIGEVHVDLHGGFALRTYDQATAIELGAATGELATRMRTFDLAWAGLSETERTRARAIHLDARIDHVTVAFKD